MVDLIHHRHSDCSNCTNTWWQWTKDHLKKPIQGFKDKKNPDGTPYTLEQQQQATYIQIYWIIVDLCRRRKSSDSIHAIIGEFLR